MDTKTDTAIAFTGYFSEAGESNAQALGDEMEREEYTNTFTCTLGHQVHLMFRGLRVGTFRFLGQWFWSPSR